MTQRERIKLRRRDAALPVSRVMKVFAELRAEIDAAKAETVRLKAAIAAYEDKDNLVFIDFAP